MKNEKNNVYYNYKTKQWNEKLKTVNKLKREQQKEEEE